MRHRPDLAQESALQQMREVLQGDFVRLAVRGYTLEEDFVSRETRVSFQLDVSDAPGIPLLGTGVGMIDAFFRALKARLGPEHPSLDSIKFSSLQVRGLIGDAHPTSVASDAQAEAQIGLKNSYGNEFVFSGVSESVSRSSVLALLAGVEYFVNSERAYIAMYRALKHYEAEGRVDLVSKYTAGLAEMVRNTSYSNVIERLVHR